MALLSPFIAIFFHSVRNPTTVPRRAVDAVESVFLKATSKVILGTTTLLKKDRFWDCWCCIRVHGYDSGDVTGCNVGRWISSTEDRGAWCLCERVLFFDYTDANPMAVFTFGGFVDAGSIKKRAHGSSTWAQIQCFFGSP
ncbi:hypothetical protein NC653_031874 [Populus alba x Populus x berolinensis]|uniref:Uncharacterized protein n=1 Tax=Populus alba x Populus x berolinensis TaxID=444605 RepID=A0AAD6LZL9_9ROSI|nr:hypothetical protein NC653_031874 [Populus alba x Populus x berolinensis]